MIKRLRTGEGARLCAIRLRALAEAPDAFSSTLDEARDRSVAAWENQIEQLANFVATLDGHDVGLVRGARHDEVVDTGYLLSMWVAPEVRRQGVAGNLVDAVVDWARQEGLRRLLLDVAVGNAPAVALYRRKGFVANGIIGILPPPREHVREMQMELLL